MRHVLPALVVINVIGCDKKADPPAPPTLVSASPISSQEAAARAAKADADKKVAEAQVALKQQVADARTKVRFEAGGSLNYMSAADIASYCTKKKMPPTWAVCVTKDPKVAPDPKGCQVIAESVGCVLSEQKNEVNFCCPQMP